MKTFSLTDIGKQRQLNQDYIYTSEEPIGKLPNLFLVADGMGGHNAGDYASRLAVETIVETIADMQEDDPEILMRKAIERANEIVRDCASQNASLEGMGTTVVAATISDGKLSICNVGDSRLYVITNGELKQITRDHSWIEEMIRRGGIGREEARNHPDKHIITRAVGAESTINPDFFKIKLDEEDSFLMCTDGLTNMLLDEEIRMVLDGARDIVEKAEELVRRANENGGKDNISVVLVEPFR